MALRDKVKNLVGDETRYGIVFNLLIKLLIILSIVSFSVETLPDLDPGLRSFLHTFELIIVIIFTAEYLLRIYAADNKWQFIFSFYGLVDLIAILPFYIATGLDLRSVRIIRLLRLFRVLKFIRYDGPVQRLYDAFVSVKKELVVFLVLISMLLYISAVGIYYFENPAQPETFKSVFHSLWWAVATLTTVGYGDIYPVTVGGRLFTFVVLMIGLGLISVPTGLIASAFTRSMESK
jgi:voltage-gated potassium channel